MAARRMCAPRLPCAEAYFLIHALLSHVSKEGWLAEGAIYRARYGAAWGSRTCVELGPRRNEARGPGQGDGDFD
jgi:hypothetical protein